MNLAAWVEIVVILLAGFWAGMINVAVGSGTLVTFPVLLLFGYPPVVANISNNIGLVAGGLAGTWGYRQELAANRAMFLRLLPASAIGGLSGAILLLVLPQSAFNTIVPVLIALGLLLVLCGPALQRRAARRNGNGQAPTMGRTTHAVLLFIGVLLLGVYGGYFGAAQGILLVGLMGAVTSVALQEINAVKNGLTTAVNALAALIFIVVAGDRIDWKAAALIAVGATLGGLVGAKVGRKLPPRALRAVIVTVGTAALVRMIAVGT
ncbi:MAG: hypothetical protein JWO93_1873 [Micrococcaceae bacterium]|nr:hypothetical protein [Micrococcaceae bacterium]